ncbi:hypothetical protein ATI02_3764 [Pseudomonas baetica]|uniref:Uncharacterized protein n=1 Tax=Pseudomonas baetica TaxID=674054 RepID=A0ABX4Q231_9PSED|nr:hypothetical protein ATI02_3764 [Pseudomonas baetica]
MWCLSFSFREQARSHIGMRYPCGSEPAREDVICHNPIFS